LNGMIETEPLSRSSILSRRPSMLASRGIRDRSVPWPRICAGAPPLNPAASQGTSRQKLAVSVVGQYKSTLRTSIAGFNDVTLTIAPLSCLWLLVVSEAARAR